LERENDEPLWLQRHREAKRLAEAVGRLKRVHIYEADEIIRIVGERYRRLRPRRPGKSGKIELELRRVETVYNIVSTRLRRALEMPPFSELSSFHQALVNAYVGREAYENARKRIARGLRLLREFWNQYRWLIATSEDPREASRLRKEASGRMLSVVRRLKKDLSLLRRVREELVRTHVIAEGLPIVVVAGIPSSGKSTIVSELSTAEPEIAAYPFTTKTVIIGKTTEGDIAYYIVDTPGILERPKELLNEIERKALAALSTLPDIVLFVFDPSPERVQDVENQLRLLRSVAETILAERNTSLLVAINKADITPRKDIEKTLDLINRTLRDYQLNLCSEPLIISASEGQGIETLRRTLAKCAREHAPWLY